MTPISLRKIEKSSQNKKVYGGRERERRKISEGLRLGGAASTCRKFDNLEQERKLGKFTMVSQPIRLILVDWFFFHFF